MCGVFGLFVSGSIDVEKTHSFLLDGIKSVHHRGPDNTGHQTFENCHLAHSRLAIVDLDSRSNQPFSIGDFHMVYNGEVFNHQELREELENEGVKFITNSDTEVVLRAYIAWGSQCFSKFNGMWVLLIYNSIEKSLVVSRDRFGQKPLFYGHNENLFAFGSEPSQICKLLASEPCWKNIQNFVLEGDALMNGTTFFDNIFEFPPAHTLKIDSQLNTEIEKYWCYPSTEAPTSEKVEAKFFDLLEDAVRIRLMADVPVCLCLTGGVDSTIISAIASDISEPRDLHFFTYQAHDNFDESNFAGIVAARLEGDLTLVKQPDDPETYISSLLSLVKNMGRGHSSPAIISSDLIHRQIAKKYKVSINGQGADELLAGYKTHYIHHFLDLIAAFRIPEFFAFVKKMFSEKTQFSSGVLKSVLINYLRDVSGPNLRKLMRIVFGYEWLVSSIKFHEQSNNLFASCFRLTRMKSSRLKSHLIKQHQNGLRDLLFYEDIVAMRNSVENRSPFLDHRLVELVFSHDYRLKVDRGMEKSVLRKSRWFHEHRDVLDRDKIGFQSSIRSQTKTVMCEQLVKSRILRLPIFSSKLEEILQNGEALKPKYERLLFRNFQVHLWNDAFFPEK